MRPEKLYLTDIVEAAQSIEKFVMGEDFYKFEQNDMMNSAVLQKLTVIDEAASRLPKEFMTRFLEFPWLDIIGLRNIAVHEYFAIRWDIAWVAVTEEVPVLKQQIEMILREEYQD
jgi:Uncharacterized conserved protein